MSSEARGTTLLSFVLMAARKLRFFSASACTFCIGWSCGSVQLQMSTFTGSAASSAGSVAGGLA